MKHSEYIGKVAYDNLVVGNETEAKPVKVTKGTEFKVGALVTITDGAAALATATAGKNYGIVADVVKADEEDTYVSVYTKGHFVKGTVEAATGIEITEELEEACRMDNILFVDSIK